LSNTYTIHAQKKPPIRFMTNAGG